MSVAILNEDTLTTDITSAMLRMAGYDVVEAVDGLDLLRLIDTDPNIEAVVINLLVPAMSGVDLFHSIRARKKTLPVVVDTGAPPNSWNGAATDPRAVVLRKKHPPEDLIAAVAHFVPIAVAG
jgi:DNA-binding NtrC family response regulator